MIALILPAEISLCPFAKEYTSVFSQSGVRYAVVQWDRMHQSEVSAESYRGRKISAKMNLADYASYALFVKKALRQLKPDKVIIFGLPLLFTLSIFGVQRGHAFGVDIRDHHKILAIPPTSRAIKRAKFCAVSSPGYLSWLPRSSGVAISHNAYALTSSELTRVDLHSATEKRPLVVGTIGQLKDLNANLSLISQLGGDARYLMEFHGTGVIDKELQAACCAQGFTNVLFTGKYETKDERRLYQRCDVISMLMTGGTLNNDTLLANRLYNSVLNGIPLVAQTGTYLSRIITQYNLGIVVGSPVQLRELDAMLADFHRDLPKYNDGRIAFRQWVVEHQREFRKDLLEFSYQIELGRGQV